MLFAEKVCASVTKDKDFFLFLICLEEKGKKPNRFHQRQLRPTAFYNWHLSLSRAYPM